MKRYRPSIPDALSDAFVALLLGWQAVEYVGREEWRMATVYVLAFLASLALVCTRRITDAMHHYRGEAAARTAQNRPQQATRATSAPSRVSPVIREGESA